MRYIVLGLGNIGLKRKFFLGSKCVATVDPFNKDSNYKKYEHVPLDSFDAAIISTPNKFKWELLNYLISNCKHVLIEKPFPFSEENFNKIKTLDKLSKKNKTIWYTSYNHRFENSIQELKKYLDKKIIGEIYFGNLIYGNGTVKNSLNSWRDDGLGVLEDLGSHLLDLISFLFPKGNFDFKLNFVNNYEMKSPDYCSFRDVINNLNFECSFLHWKNKFSVNFYGSLGSIHLDGLEKWGGSSLVIRERIFPSGRPIENKLLFKDNDQTWEKDIFFFEKKVSQLQNSFQNDLKIEKQLNKIYRNE